MLGEKITSKHYSNKVFIIAIKIELLFVTLPVCGLYSVAYGY